MHDLVDRTAERLVGEGELPWHPSFFEMLTAMAFEYFARRKVDIAVLEVGMGGRLDATNVIEPRVSVITDISLDHQKFLGDTVAEIAGEKAGIIRPGGVVVTLPQQPQANDVIGNTILELGARAVNAVPYVPPVSPASSEYLRTSVRRKTPVSRYPLQVMGEQILVETPLLGRHQLRNVALAIAAAEELGRQGFPVTAASIERGIRETHWPGRFQVLPATDGTPEYVFDVAHNPAGAWALRSTLSAGYPGSPADVCFWRDAGQGDRRDGGDSVSAGGPGDCHPRRQSALGHVRKRFAKRPRGPRPRLKKRRMWPPPSQWREPRRGRIAWWLLPDRYTL